MNGKLPKQREVWATPVLSKLIAKDAESGAFAGEGNSGKGPTPPGS